MLSKARSWYRSVRKNFKLRVQKPAALSALNMSDKAFLSILDVPEVTEAIQRNDTPTAKTALIDHYRHRKSVPWLPPPKTITDLRINIASLSQQELVRLAESILEHRFAPDGSLPKLVNGCIDWQYNPISSPEWLWRLNRHQWWPLLGHAYLQTGDERYAETFVSQMADWIGKNPPTFLKNEKSPTWRLMETAMRLYLSWIPSFSLFYEAACFEDDHKLTMLKSIYDHARFLYHFSTNRNHLLRETNGLLATSVYFPEFLDSAKWQEESLSRIDMELSKQIYPDGSHIEVSPAYQWLVVDELERTFELLKTGGLSLPTQDLGAWLEKMYAVLAMVIHPDSTFPEINDGFMRWSFTRLAEAGENFKRKDFVFVGTSGKSGETPETTSCHIADAGWTVMRSDWTDQARYLLFDTGPYGGPHGHEDKLSIEVYAYGRPFVVDSGSYTYETTDPFRPYFVGSASHNTILVDGKSQVRRWHKSNLNPTNALHNHSLWVSNDQFDYAAAEYADGYAEFHLKRPKDLGVLSDVVHKRQVLFVKPHYWIVVDQLRAHSPHNYQLLFHAAPDLNPKVLSDNQVCLEQSAASSKLLIVPAAPQDLEVALVNGSTDPVQGWFSVEHHRKTPATTVVFLRKQAVSICLTTLLYPIPAGSAPMEEVSIRTLPLSAGDGLACTVQGNSFHDYILVSDNERMKSIGTYQSQEMISIVRTARNDLNPWGLDPGEDAP